MKKKLKKRNVIAEMMALRHQKAGTHHNRSLDLKKGSSRKRKHKNKEPGIEPGSFSSSSSVELD